MQRASYLVRMAAIAAVMLTGYVALTMHVWNLQVTRHEELHTKAKSKYTAHRTELGERGRIFDCHGNLLAGNGACRDILAEPWRLRRDRGAVVDVLSVELGIPRDALQNRFSRACSPAERYPEIVVKSAVPFETVERLRKAQIKGLLLKHPKKDRPGCPGWLNTLISWGSGRAPADTGPRDVVLQTRRFWPDRDGRIARLSELLGIQEQALARRIEVACVNQDRPVEVVVARRVDIRRVETLADKLAERLAANYAAGYRDKIADRIRKNRYPGIRFTDNTQRIYPKGKLLANLLGFLDAKERGASGLEASLQAILRPTAGEAVFEKDRRGDRLHLENSAHQAPQNGADVYLTIQEPIQQIVEDELVVLEQTFKPRAAYAVMADPGTGAIMAMAQVPTFDPNDRSHMTPASWRNRILSDGFEPGSIMKAIAVAGALDYGVVSLNDVFDCEHGYWIFCRRPLRDTHAYDNLAVWEIIQKSSNIGAAKIAIEMGESRLYQVLARFGFGRPTGIGLRHEACGIFRDLDKWDGLSISRFPIGHGILATPLQLVQAYSALANGGVVMQLHVVKRIIGPQPGQTTDYAPEIKRRAIRPGAARQITAALKLVTKEGGTAPKAGVPGYEVAGKTGTAQKVVDGHYSHSKHVASFVGFVPADKPAFVLLVAVDEPSTGGRYGGTVAAPAFRRIAEKTLKFLQVPPNISVHHDESALATATR